MTDSANRGRRWTQIPRKLGFLVLPAVIALGTAAPRVPSQVYQPRSVPGLFEVYGLDFRPVGAWRTGAQRVKANRDALWRANDLTALNRTSRATAIAGSYLGSQGGEDRGDGGDRGPAALGPLSSA